MPRFYGTIMRPSTNKAAAPVTELKATSKTPPKDPKKNGKDDKESGGK